jgi:DNA polymerase-1
VFLFVDVESVKQWAVTHFNLSEARANDYVGVLISASLKELGGVEGIYTYQENLIVKGSAILSAGEAPKGSVGIKPSPHPGEVIVKKAGKARRSPSDDGAVVQVDLGSYVPISSPGPIVSGDYRLVTNLAEVIEYLGSEELVGIDTETTGLKPVTDKLLGCSLSVSPGTGIYIPTECFKTEELRSVLQQRQLVFHSSSFDQLFLGWNPDSIDYHDTKLQAFLLGSYRGANGLKRMAREHLGLEMREWTEVIADDLNSLYPYACMDADATRRLHLEYTWPKMLETGLADRYLNIEIPVSSILTKAEKHGILIDRTFVEAQIEGLERLERHLSATFPVNCRSPQQLERLIFEELGLTPRIFTGTGARSTGRKALAHLEGSHPTVDRVLSIKDVGASHTLWRTILDHLYEDSRLHPHFKQTFVITNRLSTEDPNTQNFTPEQKLAVVAPPGYAILSADCVQLEMTIMAGLSQDPYMVETVLNNEDFHVRTASLIYGTEHPTPQQRKVGKGANFSVLYGLSDRVSAQRDNTTIDEARRRMKIVWGKLDTLKKWQEGVIAEGMERGYAESWLGYRMYFEAIKDNDPRARSHARKEVANGTVQSTASGDVVKLCMVRADKYAQQLGSIFYDQIHDSLDYYVPLNAVRDMEEAVHEVAKGIGFPLPIRFKVKVGQSWG